MHVNSDGIWTSRLLNHIILQSVSSLPKATGSVYFTTHQHNLLLLLLKTIWSPRDKKHFVLIKIFLFVDVYFQFFFKVQADVSWLSSTFIKVNNIVASRYRYNVVYFTQLYISVVHIAQVQF